MKITTININGFRETHKRNKIWELLKIYNFDLILLQETHINSKLLASQIEKEWGGKTFWSFSYSNQSTGVGILVNKNLYLGKYSFCHDTDGRLLIVDITINNIDFRIINIYAPNECKDRVDFFNNIQQYCVTSRFLILAGDFNCIENIGLDKLGGNSMYGSQGIESLLEMKNNFNLIDPFRTKYPLVKEFTWFAAGKLIMERLDRFYISHHSLHLVKQVSHEKIIYSDHALVTLELIGFKNAIGKGYWKCNTTVLNDPDFLESFIMIWLDLVAKANKNYNAEWWDQCKVAFKEFLIKLSCKKSRTFKQQYNTLRNRLELLEVLNKIQPNKFNKDMISVKKEIDDMLTNKLHGHIIRSRAKVIENNEKPTRFFLRKEHARAKAKTINVLQTEKGNITDTNAIIEECRHFYADLYKKESIDTVVLGRLLLDLPTLSESDRDSCEGLITKDELANALKQMHNNKSPGQDGLPKEFYVKVFPIIGDIFVQVVNNCFIDGKLSPSQRHGLITLICKKPEKAEDLKNWRPISLLNVDYKLISKVLANRLRCVLGKIIHMDQTCAVPGRSILDNIHLIRNIIDYTNQKNLPCILLSLDQSKAFDRVSHFYLFKVLKGFNFGDNFINWVKLLYNDVSSSVIVNNFISHPFAVQRSVRQGCSMSPLLYVLCIELFAIMVRKDPKISGLCLPGSDEQAKISQYADDNTCILTDMKSINNVLKVSEEYAKASGAKLNREKSCVMLCGSVKEQPDIPYGINRVNNIKIYGVVFNGEGIFDEQNSQTILSKIRNTANLYKGRSMSIFGKATIVNVMLCSKIWYLASIMVMSPNFIDGTLKELFTFIWNNNTELVNRNTLYLDISKGGINVVHVLCKCKALLVKHVLSWLKGTKCKWQYFTIYWCGLSVRRYRSDFAMNNMPHSEFIPRFYSACMEYFNEYINLLNGVDPDFNTPTKNIYNVFINGVNSNCIPKVFSIFPTIDFNLGWTHNMCKMLEPNHRNLTWKLLHNVLPVLVNLRRFKISQSINCPHCKKPETIIHAFYTCARVNVLWFRVSQFLVENDIREIYVGKKSLLPLTEAVFNQFQENTQKCALQNFIINVTRQVIWNYRCAKLKEGIITSSDAMYESVLQKIRSRIRLDFFRLSQNDFYITWGFYFYSKVIYDYDDIKFLF